MMELLEFFQHTFNGLNSQVGIVWATNLAFMGLMGLTFYGFMRSIGKSLSDTASTRIRMDELTTTMYNNSQKDEKEKANLYKELADVRVRVATLDSEYATYKHMSERMIKNHKELNEIERVERVQERERHQKQFELLTQKLEQLSNENHTLLERLANLEQQQNEQDEHIATIRLDRNALRETNKLQSDEISELKRCIEELRQENEELRARIKEIEAYETSIKNSTVVPAIATGDGNTGADTSAIRADGQQRSDAGNTGS